MSDVWGIGALAARCRLPLLRLRSLIKPRPLDLAPDTGLVRSCDSRCPRSTMDSSEAMIDADTREALQALSQAVGEPVSDVAAWRRAKLDSESCEVHEMQVGWPGMSRRGRLGCRCSQTTGSRCRRRRLPQPPPCEPPVLHPGPPRSHLSGCGLYDLPDALGRLSGLRKLVLTQNALRDLPPSLAGLPHLQVSGGLGKRRGCRMGGASHACLSNTCHCTCLPCCTHLFRPW